MLFGGSRLGNAAENMDVMSMVSSMVQIIIDNSENYLVDLLNTMRAMYGTAALTLITDEGNMVASTLEALPNQAIERVIESIPDLMKNSVYLRNRRNSVWFREEYECVRVIPLLYGNNYVGSLLVEQQKNVECNNRRILNVLSIGLHNYLCEDSIAKACQYDKVTGLPNRDQLLECLNRRRDDGIYMGMFFLVNASEIVFNKGFVFLDEIMRIAAAVVQKDCAKEVFVAGESKLAVVIEKDKQYKCVAKMQDCLDMLIEKIPDAEFAASLAPVVGSAHRVFYLCEKVCEDPKKDTVLVIREAQNWDDDCTDDVYMSGKYREKEEEVLMDVKVEEVKAEESVQEQEFEEKDEQMEEDLNFFFNIPDIEDDV